MDDQLKKLEELPLPELISVSEADEHFLYLAKNVTQHKFSSKALKIQTPFVESSNVSDLTSETDDFIEIRHFETASKLLENFGHLIPNLTVEYRKIGNDENADAINKLINTQCADTLIQFDVINHKNHFFDEMTGQFPKVKHLSFDGHFDNLGNANSCFGELFPSVQHLTLKYMMVNHTICLERKFPHLVHLNVYMNLVKRSNSLNEELLVALFKKNQHIRSLSSSGISRYLLNAAAEELPNLKELRVDFYYEDSKDGRPYAGSNKQIRFENVTKFSMTGSSHSMPSDIHFNRLIELQTDTFPRTCSRWIDFIERNEHLEKLRIYGHYLNHTEFSRIAAAKLNLTEMTVDLAFDVENELIVQFINSHKQLNKFNLKLISEDIANTTVDVLQKNIDSKWKISKHSTEIVLEGEIRNVPSNSNCCKTNVYSVFLFVSFLLVIFLNFN